MTTVMFITGSCFAEINDCVVDPRSGLTWEYKTQDGGEHDATRQFTWDDAQRFALRMNEENYCARKTWRLPTREELRGLVDYSIAYPGPVADPQRFPNAIATYFWSASEDASDHGSAWGIGFESGFDYAYPKGHRVSVRLVSGVARSSTFEAHDDDRVLDVTTGLTWKRCGEGQHWQNNQCNGNATRMSLTQARALARAPWRLPSVEELARITDLTRTRSAINARIFPDTPSVDYWTATPYASHPALQWLVNFVYGEAYVAEQDTLAAVRWVNQSSVVGHQ